MGIYDRDYYRDDGPRSFSVGELSVVTQVVVVTCLVFAIDWLALRGQLKTELGLNDDSLRYPSEWWRLLTHGLVHADLFHLAFNMLVLWQLGRAVADAYGRVEFLAIYVLGIVCGGVAWGAAHLAIPRPALAVGASGGVTAVLLLFGLRFRQQELLFMGVIRMKALTLALMIVAVDVLGALASNRTGPAAQHIAHEAHLGGAAWAALYYFSGLSVTGLFRGQWKSLRLRSRPKLRVHAPEEHDERAVADERSINERVDEILEKISRSGEASLTREEREFLTDASRRYQQRRR